MADTDIPKFVEQADYEKGFASYYEQHIVPLLGELELDRKKAFRSFLKACAAGLGGILMFFVVCWLGYGVRDFLEGPPPTQSHRQQQHMSQASATALCLQRMTEAAQQYHVAPNLYIARHQDYLKQCVQYYIQGY